MEAIIRKVAEPFGWMGNMAPYALTHLGKEWRTAEALFQAMRFADVQAIVAIWREKSPMSAKMVAKRFADRMIVQPRSSEDVANMRIVLRLKIAQHPELKQMLLDTQDVLIVEDCSNRRNDSGLFWGAAQVDGVWVGRNMLGVLWMELREEIQSSK